MAMEVDALTKGNGRKGPKGGKGGNETRVCWKCGKPGHLAKDCKAGGKGVGGTPTPLGGKGAGKGLKCFRCGKPGHLAKDCRTKIVGEVDEENSQQQAAADSTQQQQQRTQQEPEQEVHTVLTDTTHEMGGLWLTCIDVESCSMRCGLCGECAPPAVVDEVMLASIENESTKITLGVDSGAAVTCLKPDVATDYPLIRVDGRQLRGAGGSEIASYGDRHVGLCGSDGRTRTLRCGVADVRKNLLAVCQLVDQDGFGN